jgi:hypothetical protein
MEKSDSSSDNSRLYLDSCIFTFLSSAAFSPFLPKEEVVAFGYSFDNDLLQFTFPHPNQIDKRLSLGQVSFGFLSQTTSYVRSSY